MDLISNGFGTVGTGMLLYGLKVYGCIPFMSSGWEKQKVKELIEKENGQEEDIHNVRVPLNKQIQYDLIKKRVRALRNFYRHITAYVIVIVVLLGLLSLGLQIGQDLFVYIAYGTAFGWTMGLIVHIFGLYGTSLFMGKNWEERKLRELIKEEDEKL